jgi:hypothetical protein
LLHTKTQSWQQPEMDLFLILISTLWSTTSESKICMSRHTTSATICLTWSKQERIWQHVNLLSSRHQFFLLYFRITFKKKILRIWRKALLWTFNSSEILCTSTVKKRRNGTSKIPVWLSFLFSFREARVEEIIFKISWPKV